jgi:isopentenyl diphosphate isomerase/L-lactate dehydrogenase-like FMN-dependent dehydrogenase
VLVDVRRIDTATTMLGTPVAMPVGLAPVAMQSLAHADGEVAVARAAARASVVQVLSTMSSRSLEAVAGAPAGPRWFQLYVHKDRGVSAELVRRAATAGYTALVLTVDLPVPGYRDREMRVHFEVPEGERLGNFAALVAGGRELIPLIAGMHDQGVTWTDLAWLRSLSALPLVVKGILTAEDARLAVEHGAAAVVVSNHGGRQLDGVLASIEALPEVVQAVGGRAEVYVDGGIRRGRDVLVALALGARAVLIGRPYLFALAAGGEAGVTRALELLHAELHVGMQLLGTPAIADITPAHACRAPERPRREAR